MEFFSILIPFSTASKLEGDEREIERISHSLRRARSKYITNLVNSFGLPLRRVSFGFTQDVISKKLSRLISNMPKESDYSRYYIGVSRYCYIAFRPHLKYFVSYATEIEGNKYILPNKNSLVPLIVDLFRVFQISEPILDEELLTPEFTIISLEDAILRNDIAKKVFSFNDRGFLNSKVRNTIN